MVMRDSSPFKFPLVLSGGAWGRGPGVLTGGHEGYCRYLLWFPTLDYF